MEPFGAGQFIMNCYTASLSGTVNFKFHEAEGKVNGNDIIDNIPETSIWRAYPQSGEATIGKYPYRTDTFTEEIYIFLAASDLYRYPCCLFFHPCYGNLPLLSAHFFYRNGIKAIAERQRLGNILTEQIPLLRKTYSLL